MWSTQVSSTGPASRELSTAETLDLPATIGARSLSQWLSRTTRLSVGEAGRRTRLTKDLAAHDQTRQAVAAGVVLPEQATVIADAVEALDEEYAAEADRAEAYLIAEAAHFDAYRLRELGTKLVEVIDPDGAEAHEAKKLAEQEARASKATEMRFRNGGDGTVRGSFVLPALQAEMFRKALQALAAPKHVRATEGAGAYDYEKPTPHKLGLAFLEYIERYPLEKIPTMGGLAATVVITADADIFAQDAEGGGAQKSGRTEGGVGVSPGQLLRLACEAKLVPAVLDKGGHVLDLGRTHRFHNAPQRLALIIEQRTCQHPACDTAGAFCHVHHTTAWAHGGTTTTRHAVLLCPFHHHQAHAQGTDYPLRT